MKKKEKTPVAKGKTNRLVSRRKNTSQSTRSEGRQRSGNNGPQQGSH